MGNTKHKYDCQRVFKNYDASCPRCQELMAGSKPRDGWQKAYFSKKKTDEQRRLNDIRNHDCNKNGCGPVCTAFDW